MAKRLEKTGVQTGQIIFASEVSQSIDAFTGVEAYDINLSGSLDVTGSTKIEGDTVITGSLSLKGTTETEQDTILTINTSTGKIHHLPKSTLTTDFVEAVKEDLPDPEVPTLQNVTAEGNTTDQDITIGGTLTSANFKHTGKSVHLPNVSGWYTILSFNADSSRRGGGNLILSTTGGDFRPTTWVIKYHDDWGSGAGSKGTLKLEQYGTNDKITKARIISDQNTPSGVREHLEIYIKNTTFDGLLDSERGLDTTPNELSYGRGLVIYNDKLLGFGSGIGLNIDTFTAQIWDTDSDSVQTVNVETLQPSTFDTVNEGTEGNKDILVKELEFIIQGTSIENLLVKSAVLSLPSGSNEFQDFQIMGTRTIEWEVDQQQTYFDDDYIILSSDLNILRCEIQENPTSGVINVVYNNEGTYSYFDKQVSDGQFTLDSNFLDDETSIITIKAPKDSNYPFYRITVVRANVASHGDKRIYAIIEKLFKP